MAASPASLVSESEPGYDLFTMRPAAPRAWRIGRPCDYRIDDPYDKGARRHRARRLMSRKVAAVRAPEGEYSEDGLAALEGEDKFQTALSRSLADRIDEADTQRSWTKVTSGPKTVRVPVDPRPMDDLPAGSQSVGEAFVKSRSKPMPPGAGTGFPGIPGRAAAVDAASAAFARIEPVVDPSRAKVRERFRPPNEPIGLKVHRPEPEPAAEAEPEPDGASEVTKFTNELLPQMFANLSANGMTLEVVAG